MTPPTAPAHSPRQAVRQPDAGAGQISPDGRWLSWLAPKDGVLNIWLAPVGRHRRGARHHQRPQARHPLPWLGLRQHARALHAGRGRHRGLAHLCGGDRERRDARPDAARRASGPHPRAEPRPARRRGRRHQRPRQGLARPLPHRYPHRRARAAVREPRGARRASCSTGSCARGWPSRRAPRRAAASSTASTAPSSSRSMVVEHEDDLTTCTDRLHARRHARSTGISSVGRDKAALLAMDWRDAARSACWPSTPRPTSAACIAHPRDARRRGGRRRSI